MEIGVSLSPTQSQFAPILFAGHLDQGLETASALGYAGVELSLRDSTQIDLDSLLEKMRRYRLKVYAIATGQTWVTDGCSFYHADGDRREKTVERVRNHIALAAELHCMVIIGGIRGKILFSSESEKEELERQGTSAIARCLEHAEKRSVTLLLEPINRYETNVVNTLEEGLRMIRRLGSSRFKLLPDTFHMNIEEESIPESILHAGGEIAYVHLADSNRLSPGWGHIDFPAIAAALKTIPYDGPLGIEVISRTDDRSAMRQAISYVKSLLASPERAS